MKHLNHYQKVKCKAADILNCNTDELRPVVVPATGKHYRVMDGWGYVAYFQHNGRVASVLWSNMTKTAQQW